MGLIKSWLRSVSLLVCRMKHAAAGVTAAVTHRQKFVAKSCKSVIGGCFGLTTDDSTCFLSVSQLSWFHLGQPIIIRFIGLKLVPKLVSWHRCCLSYSYIYIFSLFVLCHVCNVPQCFFKKRRLCGLIFHIGLPAMSQPEGYLQQMQHAD